MRSPERGLERAYQKVAAALRARILDRTLREGDRLPTESELARQFGVNRSTVREAFRELQAAGLLAHRRGSKRMSVARPAPARVAHDVRRALSLYEVSYFDVWEALTLLEPPIAEIAARRRTRADLEHIAEVAARFDAHQQSTSRTVHHAAEFLRCCGAATHNRVLTLAQEPLLQLLEPSLGAMIDRVPQARSRIITAQRHLLQALAATRATYHVLWTPHPHTEPSHAPENPPSPPEQPRAAGQPYPERPAERCGDRNVAARHPLLQGCAGGR